MLAINIYLICQRRSKYDSDGGGHIWRELIFCFQDSIPEDGGGGERVEEFKFTN
jgi:hypothetical protein